MIVKEMENVLACCELSSSSMKGYKSAVWNPLVYCYNRKYWNQFVLYGAWHTKPILLFFRNRRIDAYCGDMWKWHIRSQSMWHSTDQSIHWPLQVRGEIVKWFKEYNIKSIMSVWAFSPFQGTWRIKLTVLCALWPFLWGNASWYKCWPSPSPDKSGHYFQIIPITLLCTAWP